MPYTSHGHLIGEPVPGEPEPRMVARCGGPAICPKCAVEANQARVVDEHPAEQELGS